MSGKKDLAALTANFSFIFPLNDELFKTVKAVGISAGASTPDYLINGVANKIKEFEKEERL